MFEKERFCFTRLYKAVQQTNTATDLGRLCTEMENGIDEALINETIHIVTKIEGYMYLKKDVENLNLERAHMYNSGTQALQSIPPTDDAFRQHVLRAIFQTQIWVNPIAPFPQLLDPYEFGFMNKSNYVKSTHMLA